jgi:hypothetical protein
MLFFEICACNLRITWFINVESKVLRRVSFLINDLRSFDEVAIINFYC